MEWLFFSFSRWYWVDIRVWVWLYTCSFDSTQTSGQRGGRLDCTSAVTQWHQKKVWHLMSHDQTQALQNETKQRMGTCRGELRNQMFLRWYLYVLRSIWMQTNVVCLKEQDQEIKRSVWWHLNFIVWFQAELFHLCVN